MMNRTRAIAFCVSLLVLSASAVRPAEARDLFEASVEDPLTGDTVTAGGSSITDLIEDVIESRNDFANFEDQDFQARLTYAGVRDAVEFDVDDDNNQLTVRSRLTGLDETFEGESRSELEDELRDFFEGEGSSEYAALQREISRRSVVAVLDGNPGATTARLSRHTYHRYGIGRAGPEWPGPNRMLQRRRDGSVMMLDGGRPRPVSETTNEDGEQAERSGRPERRRAWLGANFRGESGEAGDWDVVAASASLDFGFLLTDYFGLGLAMGMDYVEIDDALVIHSGFEAGLPIRLLNHADLGVMHLSWQLTPVGRVGAGASVDMGSGGLLWSAGGANHLLFDFDRFDIEFATQLDYYDSIDITVDDIDVKSDISQFLLTTGVRANLPLGNRLILSAGTDYARYLDDAAVQQWVSPNAGLGFRTGHRGTLGVDYHARIGEGDYMVHQMAAGYNLRF